MLLVERIKQTINKRPNHRKIKLSPLPDTPKVIVEGKELFILYENGSKEFWGMELDDDLEETASKMELELRAIKWVKSEIERFIGDLTEDLRFT